MRQAQGRTVITLTEAAEIIDRSYGYKPSVATIWRWARKGLRGHRLATIRIGRLYRTTVAAVHEFVECLSRIDEEPAQGQPWRGSSNHGGFTQAEVAEAKRQREAQIAKSKLRLRQYKHGLSTSPDPHKRTPS